MSKNGSHDRAKREELFRLLVDNVLDYAIFIIASDGTVQTWSEAAERLLGYAEVEILGRASEIFYTPEDRRDGVPELEREQAVATGRGEDDRWHVRKDGTRFWSSGVMTPLWDEAGALRGFAKIMRDRTEWKQADEARQGSDARRAAVLETSLDGILTIDCDDRIVEFNPAAEQMFGHRREDVLGRKMAELIVPERLRQAHYEGMARYFTTGQGPVLGKRLVLSALRADSSEFPVELAITRVPGEGPALFTGYVRDITARDTQERRLAAHLAVTEVLAEATSIREAVPPTLLAICKNLDWDFGCFWLVNRQQQQLDCLHVCRGTNLKGSEFEETSRVKTFALGKGLPGQVWQSGGPIWIADISADRNFSRLAVAAAAGLHSAIAVPILLGTEVLGVMEFFSRSSRAQDNELLGMLAAVGGHVGQFIGRKANEELLRDSEEQFRTAFELAAVGAVQVDPATGRFLRVNPKFCEITGYAPSELAGLTIRDLTHHEDREADWERVSRLLRGEVDHYSNDKRYLRKGGETVWVSVTASLIRAADATPLRTIAIVQDLTERRKAEEELLKSERRFHRLFEANIVGVGVSGANGDWFEANDELLRILGYSREDLLAGKLHWKKMTPEEYVPLDERGVAEAKERGACRPYEKEYIRSDGVRVPVLLGYARLDDAGELFVCFVLDITEQRRVSEALLESEQRFRAISDHSVAGIAETDLTGRMTFINERYCEILSRSRDELLGGVRMQDVTHPHDLHRNWPLFKRLVDEGTPFVIEKRYVRPDGSDVWVTNSVSGVRRQDGTVKNVVAVSVDVTDRRRAEDELREANRRKDEFLAMLAHELRNPLAPIRTGLDLLAMSGTDGEVVGAMQQQVVHLVRLVDDLLDVSRIMRGRIELRKELVSLESIVKRAVETIRPQIDARRQQLSVSLQPERVQLLADPVRLSQVVSNLLHNASKYNEVGGRIMVSSRVDDREAVLTVTDSGMGIEPELLPKVFELFTQASRSIDRSQGGLGIGLTVVKSLVEMHGGSVTAQSGGPGMGSEFAIHIPVSDPVDNEKPMSGTVSATSAYSILVVDDNAPAATMLARLLQRLGEHRVNIAHDGPSALEAATAHRPDIILLDIGLPRMDGYEVARRLRERPEFERTLVIALTGYGTGEDRRKSLHAGCDDHLVKPLSLDALKYVLAHAKLPQS